MRRLPCLEETLKLPSQAMTLWSQSLVAALHHCQDGQQPLRLPRPCLGGHQLSRRHIFLPVATQLPPRFLSILRYLPRHWCGRPRPISATRPVEALHEK